MRVYTPVRNNPHEGFATVATIPHSEQEERMARRGDCTPTGNRRCTGMTVQRKDGIQIAADGCFDGLLSVCRVKRMEKTI